jgi:Peptidase family M23
MYRVLAVTAALFLASLANAGPALGAWIWPLQGEVITPYRNGDDPYAGGQHRGIDIAGALGGPVTAAAAGEVRFAGTAGSSGLTVSVRTDDGFDTSYLHLGATQVSAGERVSAGQRLGAVGTSGVRSTVAPHLHFGVREAGSRHAYRDPLAFLSPLSAPLPEAPAGASAPEPASPAPVVAPAPRALPSPGRLPARRPAPGARRFPLPRPAPGARRLPARRRIPADPRVSTPRPVPTPRAAPSPVPAGQRLKVPEPHPAAAGRPAAAPSSADASTAARDVGRPALGAAPAEIARSRASAAGTTADRSPGAPSASAAGPDIGWALACAGVLLAAAILALGGDGRGARRGGGAKLAAARLGAAIRPLLGRR